MRLRVGSGWGIAAVLLLIGSMTVSARRLMIGQRSTETNAESIHGVEVSDTYRWLEEDDSAATKEWLARQHELLEKTLGSTETRRALRQRLTELVRFDTFGAPLKAGADYFYTRLDAGDPQSHKRIIVRAANGSERVLAGPAGPDETLAGFKPSPDGAYVAISRANTKTGSRSLSVIRTRDSRALPDVVERRGGPLPLPEWLPDSSGFYYAAPDHRPEAPTAISQYGLYFHRLDTSNDTEIDFPGEKGLLVSPRITGDGRYLLITLQRGTDTRNRVILRDLKRPRAADRDVTPAWEAAFTFLGSVNNRLWFYTDDRAPRGRVIAIDLQHTDRPQWHEIIAQQPEAISARDQTGINALGMFGGRLVLMYLRDGQPFLRVFNLKGDLLHTVSLPAAGSIWGGFSGNARDTEVFYWFLGLTDPSTIYRLEVTSGHTSIFAQPHVPFDRSRYTVRQDFYDSADGTRIPIFVAHRSDLKRDSSAPTWLYGYGALGWVSFIWYQPHILAWLEMGGVYAQPSLRGGGEYGEGWHQAALKSKKVKAVEDYLTAAQWLISKQYTSSARLVANGGSLSAPLAAAAVERRPDLFGAAVIDRPVTDMVRYERFTGGAFWSPEFGSVENPDEFKSLLALSAYHNAQKPGCRPPTLILAGELDRTAPPLHARKLAAALQASQSCRNPAVLKMMAGATHNFGNTPEQQVDSYGDLLAFLTTLFKLTPRAIPDVH